VKRVAVIATATSCGKTTFGRRPSERLGVPFVELDALNHVGPDWIEATHSLLLFALRTYRPRRKLYPVQLARFHLVRVRSQREVEDFLTRVGRAT
jgi:hypothetical protein